MTTEYESQLTHGFFPDKEQSRKAGGSGVYNPGTKVIISALRKNDLPRPDLSPR